MLHCPPVLTRLKPTTTCAWTQLPQNRDLPNIAVDGHFSHQPSFGHEIPSPPTITSIFQTPLHLTGVSAYLRLPNILRLSQLNIATQYRSQSVLNLPAPITTGGFRERTRTTKCSLTVSACRSRVERPVDASRPPLRAWTKGSFRSAPENRKLGTGEPHLPPATPVELQLWLGLPCITRAWKGEESRDKSTTSTRHARTISYDSCQILTGYSRGVDQSPSNLGGRLSLSRCRQKGTGTAGLVLSLPLKMSGV